jgi:hypothetical protein
MQHRGPAGPAGRQSPDANVRDQGYLLSLAFSYKKGDAG